MVGKQSNKNTHEVSPSSPPLETVEIRSIQTRSSITTEYHDAIDSEHSFQIEAVGHDEEDFEAISDITVVTSAINAVPEYEHETWVCEPRNRSKMYIFLACVLFAVCLLAATFADGGAGADGGILPPVARVSGDQNEGDGQGGVTQAVGPPGVGRIVEFTVANLNTNAENCTHVPDAHALKCSPSHDNATNKFRIQLRPEWSALGVGRFESLTASGFWDGVRVFRMVPGFVSQFGISSSPETQGRWEALGPIPDDPVVATNVRGAVSFATAGKDMRTTQLFINMADNAYLDDQGFAPIGEVLPAGGVGTSSYGGMEVVEEFYAGYDEEPSQSRIREEGEAYLEGMFPLLSYFATAEFVDEHIFER